MQILYDGKAKTLYPGPDPQTVIVFFKDSVTAGDGKKRASIPGKGALAAQISVKLFELLKGKVPSHYLKQLDKQSFLAHRVQIIPLEVVVRNCAAGSIVKRLGLTRGQPFTPPLLELFYKSDALHDPPICDAHALALNITTQKELAQIKHQALHANAILTDYFASLGLKLVDMKFEFGRTPDGEILLADEISPDTMRLWDAHTNESLDKDVFREDTGDLLEVYREVARRMGL
ncbi:MAG: phosphoribosylaminoimidazolesuccinocarboxamide synthase [Candidatus Bipolaricaulia bacterium]